MKKTAEKQWETNEPKARKAKATVQQWEYHTLNWGSVKETPTYEAAVRRMQQNLNELGAEGWEAFAVVPYAIYLKRPVKR